MDVDFYTVLGDGLFEGGTQNCSVSNGRCSTSINGFLLLHTGSMDEGLLEVDPLTSIKMAGAQHGIYRLGDREAWSDSTSNAGHLEAIQNFSP
jgi:hypothetical protein